MTHSLDSESDPAYVPSSHSHSSLGSNSAFSCNIDMEPAQGDFPIPVASAGVPTSFDAGDYGVIVRGAGEPSTSKPRIECPPDSWS